MGALLTCNLHFRQFGTGQLTRAGSILFQITALFVVSIVLAIVIVLSKNVLLRDQTQQTLAKEIFSAGVLFDKTRDSLYQRMEYYAFDSDPGRPDMEVKRQKKPYCGRQSQNQGA